MAPTDEKAIGLTVTTTATTNMNDDKTLSTITTASGDTLAPSLAPSPYPSRGTSQDLHRPSDVSTPATAGRELNPFDTDLEAMVSTRTIVATDDACGMKSASNCNLKGSPDGQVWPGQEHWKKKAKAARVNNRSCQPLARMSKRNRIIVRVLIIALVVGIAVGVGLGISRSLHAGIWKPNGN